MAARAAWGGGRSERLCPRFRWLCRSRRYSVIEYTVLLSSPPNPPDDAVIVVQSALPQLYPSDVGMAPSDPVNVRVVGSSRRVMRRSPVEPCSQTPLPIG